MVRERGAAAQARSKRRRILAKFLAHVGSECVRCAMLLLGAVLDMTCAQKHSFETCALLFPTFFRSLPLSVREEMFGNGFHARIGAVILPASSSGCEWYSLRSAPQHHVAGQSSGLHDFTFTIVFHIGFSAGPPGQEGVRSANFCSSQAF